MDIAASYSGKGRAGEAGYNRYMRMPSVQGFRASVTGEIFMRLNNGNSKLGTICRTVGSHENPGLKV